MKKEYTGIRVDEGKHYKGIIHEISWDEEEQKYLMLIGTVRQTRGPETTWEGKTEKHAHVNTYQGSKVGPQV